MKLTKSTLLAFILLIIVASLYRVWDGRPFGFAPQMAMAIFAGAVIKDKRWAVLLPLLSMFLSDCLYQVLYLNGLAEIKGFYSGMVGNYALIALLTCFGFLMRKITLLNVAGFSIAGSVLYFIVSNFMVWIGGGGYARPITFDGMMLCYGDALAFYRDYGLIKGFAGNFIIGDLFFSAILFGSYFLLRRPVLRTSAA
jgi:hypothetical protein